MSELDVLVTGATGFVGARLVAALVGDGHRVRAMTRRAEGYDGPGTAVAGDVADPDSLRGALAGMDAAYYLIHSLGSDDFEERDAAAARAFGAAAAEAGVRQIIYLGGLGGEGADLSPHLRSRREVESLLGQAGVPVTVLRAAIVVGHGGISWEMTRQLLDRLPVMAAPSWAATKTQPIALADVVRYLVGVLDHPQALGRVFEVGGADVLSYEEMLKRAALIQNNRAVPVVSVPLSGGDLVTGAVAKASSYALSLLTDVDADTARTLIGSMDTEVVVSDSSIDEVVLLEPLGYEEMVTAALEERLAAGDPV